MVLLGPLSVPPFHMIWFIVIMDLFLLDFGTLRVAEAAPTRC